MRCLILLYPVFVASMSRFLLLCLNSVLFLPFSGVHAAEVSPAVITQLAKDTQWHKLLHIGADGNAIHSDRFYLSSSHTPEDELVATLEALADPADLASDDHAQCRFPARALWLASKLGAQQVLPQKARCEALQEWLAPEQVNGISLVFASGFMDNPASYYGHTLITLNKPDSQRTALLDTAVNFGAEVPDNENPVSYIIKGLVGGYNADFTHSDYYLQTKNYNNNELRDLWEYELNLTPQDRTFLAAHIWELLKQHFTYYFLDDNCVSRMYNLFSILPDITLTPLNDYYVIPQQTLKNLMAVDYRGQPLVKAVHYKPSKQTQFLSKYRALTRVEQQWVARITDTPEVVSDKQFSVVPAPSKLRVLETLLDYFRLVVNKAEDDELVSAKAAYAKILAVRYQLPAQASPFSEAVPASPDNSRSASYLQAAALINDGKAATLFTFRPAYYDPLDASTGHIEHGHLEMAGVSLWANEDAVAIYELNLLHILSVKNLATGLPGDNYHSWELYVGAEQQSLACGGECLQMKAEAKTGWAQPLSSRIFAGVYVGGMLSDNVNQSGNVAALASGFIQYQWLENINVRLEAGYAQYLGASHMNNWKTTLSLRYVPDSNADADVRARFSKDDSGQQAMIAVGWYF